MRVLPKEEAFALMERNFARLKPYEVLDLCHESERFPAIVVSVDYARRMFDVVPLTRAALVGLLDGNCMQETKTIRLPSSPDDAHPAWNTVGK